MNICPHNIKPLPSISGDSPPKKRYKGKTAILTSLEYRQELEEKQNKVRAKKKAPQPNKKKVIKSKIPKNLKKNCLKSKNTDCNCFYCNGLYSESTESWVQCKNCKKWSHDSCAGIDEDYSDEYICDYCEE